MKKKIFKVWMIIAGLVVGIAAGSQDVYAREKASGPNSHEVDNVTLGTIENTMITAPYNFANSDSFEFLRLLNDERMKAGLNPVQMNANLLSDAQQRAAEIALVLYGFNRPAGNEATPLKGSGAQIYGRMGLTAQDAFDMCKSYGDLDMDGLLMNPEVYQLGIAHYDNYWYCFASYYSVGMEIVERDVPAVECREITIELGNHPRNFCVMRKDMEDAYHAGIFGNPSVGVPYFWAMLLDNDKNDIVSVHKNIQFYASEEEHCTKVSCDGKITKVDTKYGSPSMYTWASSNTKVAKIDTNGLVTTLSEGTTVISCTPKYGGTAATYRLTVESAASSGENGVSVPEVKKNIKVKVQDITYKVTNTKKQTVTLTKAPKTKKVVVPASITINGKAYKVTSVGKKAFAGNTKLTQVTIGKNVKKIETKAFYGCKKLKKVVYKGKKSKISKGSKAFGKCNKLKKKYK